MKEGMGKREGMHYGPMGEKGRSMHVHTIMNISKVIARIDPERVLDAGGTWAAPQESMRKDWMHEESLVSFPCFVVWVALDCV